MVKQPFGSSSGESYGKSQVGDGSGSSAGRNEAASKPNPTINDALSYLKKVKDMFPDQKEKCPMFLDVMNDFKNRRIDTPGVIAIVKNLFKERPSLLLEFNTFLPEGYEITLNDIENEAPPRKTVDFEEAINLVNNIKKRFENNDHVYKSFLEIIKMHRHKNINEVYHEVAILLKDHPDLLDEFTKFLPDSANVNLLSKEQKTRAEKENMERRTHDEDYKMKSVVKVEELGGHKEDTFALKYKYNEGFPFCKRVKERVQNPADYQTFLKCLHVYRTLVVTRKQLQSLVFHAFGKYPDLMKGFNEFIERYERVDGFFGKWIDGSTTPKLVKEVEKEEEQQCKTEASSTNQIKEENEAPPQGRKLEEALSFMKKVKKRFQDGDRYRSFLNILKMYREEQKNTYEVYHEVAILLNDHPDLLNDFRKFLPNSNKKAC